RGGRVARLPRSGRAADPLGSHPRPLRRPDCRRGGADRGQRISGAHDAGPGRMTLRQRLLAPARDPLWAASAAVLASLAVSFLAILASGKDPVLGFAHLFEGAFGGPGPLGETAIKGGVLVLTGLSVAVAFTVGL